LRNRVRRELLPMMAELAGRDVVPLLARQATVLAEDRGWLDALALTETRALHEIDCRELATWPRARLTRWLRVQLRADDGAGGWHPPTSAELDRVLRVIHGDVVAVELSGGRRVARSARHLSLE
jgi:tRNA(Ile)-lysidine synthase